MVHNDHPDSYDSPSIKGHDIGGIKSEAIIPWGIVGAA
jgi:hypothetical protein